VVSTILFDNDIKALNEKLKEANASEPEREIKRFPNTNIHEPFIRIAHHAYVNNFNFSPIRRIRKIVKWYRFDEEKEVS
jgi:glutamyl-tRNA reductase